MIKETLNIFGEHIHDKIKKEYPDAAHKYELNELKDCYCLQYIFEDKRTETEIFETDFTISFNKNENRCSLTLNVMIQKPETQSTTIMLNASEEDYLQKRNKDWTAIYRLLLESTKEFLENENLFRLQKVTNDDFFEDLIERKYKNYLLNQKK